MLIIQVQIKKSVLVRTLTCLGDHKDGQQFSHLQTKVILKF